MKFQTTTVTFRKEIEVEVVFPPDSSVLEVEAVAKTTDLTNWDEPDWEVFVSTPTTSVVSASSCKLVSGSLRYGASIPAPGFFNRPNLLVLDDRHQKLVLPEEASWWVASEEDERLERQNEFNPNQLLLFGV